MTKLTLVRKLLLLTSVSPSTVPAGGEFVTLLPTDWPYLRSQGRHQPHRMRSYCSTRRLVRLPGEFITVEDVERVHDQLPPVTKWKNAPDSATARMRQKAESKDNKSHLLAAIP